MFLKLIKLIFGREGWFKMNDIHVLKVVEPYYTALKERKKTFEVRRFDRDYKVGDVLILKKYNPALNDYNGEIHCAVTYILSDKQYCKEGYCIMGLAFSNGNDKYQE